MLEKPHGSSLMLAMWVLVSIYMFWPYIKTAGEIVIEGWKKVVLMVGMKRACFHVIIAQGAHQAELLHHSNRSMTQHAATSVFDVRPLILVARATDCPRPGRSCGPCGK
jgi:hypothetical protein